MLEGIGDVAEATLHDLYEEYPDFNIDAAREQSLLLDHRIIIWHTPFYMYGVPALLKQWIDLVLEYGWAHGKDGDKVRAKFVFNAVTAGGTRDAYAHGGHNGFTVREFLAPFEQTARLCKMVYLPPFVVHGTYLLTDEQIGGYGALYGRLLRLLTRGKVNPDEARTYEYLNDWLAAHVEVLP